MKPLGVTMASKPNCNQIKIFINLEIIGEEKFYLYIYLKSKNLYIVALCPCDAQLNQSLSINNFFN